MRVCEHCPTPIPSTFATSLAARFRRGDAGEVKTRWSKPRENAGSRAGKRRYQAGSKRVEQPLMEQPPRRSDRTGKGAGATCLSRPRADVPQPGGEAARLGAAFQTASTLQAPALNMAATPFHRDAPEEPERQFPSGFRGSPRNGGAPRVGLPCRRSWVRVPSSALRKPRKTGILWPGSRQQDPTASDSASTPARKAGKGRCGPRSRRVAWQRLPRRSPPWRAHPTAAGPR